LAWRYDTLSVFDGKERVAMAKKAFIGFALVLVVAVLFFKMAPAMLEKSMNIVVSQDFDEVPADAQQLHKSLLIGDLHADSLLWSRDLLSRSERGHVDLPRLQEGNVALQMFTTVTKSPSGQNYHSNSSDAPDNISRLAMVQLWPQAAWSDLSERALYQAEKLQYFIDESEGQLRWVRSQAELQAVLEARRQDPAVVGALLGTEGSHALSGDLANIERLYRAGFRMMSLQHFFDNKLGGSLHGTSKQGLTPFGREAVKRMFSASIMIDVAHSSEAVVKDVLAMSDRGLIVSHTGFRGHCESERNISDQLMQSIAAQGGVIGVGYWQDAVCGIDPKDVAEAIVYGVNLVGEDAVALGSDYDGSVATSFDTSKLSLLTAELLSQGLTEAQIRKVMGENMQRFLALNLPAS